MAVDIIESLSNQFITICKQHKLPYVADITSNGYLLNLDTFMKLYQCHVFHYTLTIDGVRDTHDNQKPLANGDKTFDVVVNNLMEIKEKIKHNYFNIVIRTNFSTEIYSHLKEYIDFFYDRFSDDKRFSFFARPVGNWGGESVKDFSDKLLNENHFVQVFKDMIAYEKTLDYRKHMSFIQPGGSICTYSNINTYLFDSEGNIRKCSCDLDNEKAIIGKISSDGSLDIDFNQEAKWVEFFEPKGLCKDCFFAPACLNNACLAKKVLGRGNKDVCDVYEKNYIGYMLQLIDKTDEIEVLS